MADALNAIICPKHGGNWGNDPTCTLCTDDEGNALPVDPFLEDDY